MESPGCLSTAVDKAFQINHRLSTAKAKTKCIIKQSSKSSIHLHASDTIVHAAFSIYGDLIALEGCERRLVHLLDFNLNT